ncbi:MULTISPECIES: holo-ACP synthase [Clostridium]|jgi:holo-[acyl-carrier protein] synthase|uniref:Holo-[acyl-carrier-protein] synthase n=1 Tax=Clostridium saccharoperbutylacetonicum N1-4(HMT) TaxID=931276 RepID=M1M144_9CLOT|nr:MULTISPECIES: holo-ACP synthase [Clostridium]AGF59275.1 holo-[acyl-carrier-protein] synthase AcpS [Clostridium saccharoperbutylacetonicum N1-4(HMT)]AQR97946.1 holo-[acyl-carrier-protein] synthase [Clostridium saccharoperbutylacetonicum]NRT59937.1 holo-[acyl-carrier protein] synthase [Clostridium saccharoperbutylacetonicum]NSB23249.1 holo-[acyl-carrier protein] synthase [Clostridium saccharoperbutylacetonicum]NSB33839.1 holo-[acyl-carrier protein] synthase [Clostridium saccharoperbutylaceton
MIIGIGTDIIEIGRIEKVISRTRSFIERSFTTKEIEYFSLHGFKGNVIAGNFAAKEAISKALGTGFRGFGLKDIEVLRDELGKPIVYLNDNINKIVDIKKVNIHVSISHSKENAIAYAVMEVI